MIKQKSLNLRDIFEVRCQNLFLKVYRMDCLRWTVMEPVISKSYVFSVEDAAGNSRARERVDGLKKNQAASETRHTGVSARRASPIDRTADHWLTPAAIASRLCEPGRTNAKHKLQINSQNAD
jgi:hypothetical protein